MRPPAEPAGSLQSEKAVLRGRMREIRAAIGADERHRLAGLIEQRLFALPELPAARVVVAFSSFGSEVPTQDVIRRLASGGKRVLLPFIRDGEMETADRGDEERLVASGYGPKEPAGARAVDPAEVDVALVPGLAFDPAGHRLGYGGGHFDRYLARLRPEAVRIALAFHVQLLPSIPHGPGDQRVDVVVTDQETFRYDRR